MISRRDFYNFFQMPYINRNDVLPTVKWMKSAVFYQIFVDRFSVEIQKGPLLYPIWSGGAADTEKFCGRRSLRNVEKLDYLKELGITAIYLTPIFRSISNHKCDTMDYMQIDPQFGTKEEFRGTRAHGACPRNPDCAGRSIQSLQHARFCDVMGKRSESPYYDWF